MGPSRETASTRPAPAGGGGQRAVNQLVLKTLLQQGEVSNLALVSDGVAAVAAWGGRRLGRDPDGRPDAGHGRADRDPKNPGPRSRDRTRPHADRRPDRQRHGSTRVAEYSLDAGMDGFVSKPIEVARLFAAIDAALAPHTAQAAAALA